MPELDPADGKPLHGGYLNSVVRHGGSVRKAYLGTQAEDRRRLEVCALTCLARRLPVPRVLHGGDDRSLVVEFVDGINGQRLMREGRAALALRLCGIILRRLQAVDVLTMNGRLPGAGDVMVHGDFGPQNVLIRPAGEVVSTVIDWEFCHLGAPIEDLAWAEWIVRRHQRDAIEFLPEFFTGYGCQPEWVERRHSMLRSLRRMRSFAVENGDPEGVGLWDERIADTAAWGRSEFQTRGRAYRMSIVTHREPITFPTWPSLNEDDIAAVTTVLRSSKISQLSSHAVSSFEAGLAAFIGVEHAVAVNSGTAALHTALAALQIAPGDEVLVPSHTFIGSASPIVHQGATPVFVDVDERSFCLTPESIRRSITPRTRAIIAVHLNGAAAPLDEITAIAEGHGIPVIEDVAQAIGATYHGQALGSIGTLAAFSFWEDKIITTGGEGGAVVTNDATLADRMRRFRHHGESRPPGARVYASTEVGHNYRLTAIQAALGASQLQRIESFLDARRSNAQYLSSALSTVKGIETPLESAGSQHAFWKYVCRVTGSDEATIDRITAQLQEQGVPAFRRYPVPLHRQPAFTRMGLSTDQCSVSDQLASELFSLPVHPLITPSHIAFMAEKIAEVTAACL